MSRTDTPGDPLDAVGRPRGPCLLCGHADARHRIYDVIRERHRAGDSVESLAADYRMELDNVRAIVEGPEV